MPNAFVDKFLVRQVVVDMGLEELLIPSLGVFTSAAEIPFDDFPEKFVLKATHGSGWTIVCKNKASFDQNAAIEEMSGWLKRNFYREGREWPYKELQPRIVAEVYLEGENGEPPPDLKIFCFHGEPKIIQVDSDRFVEHRRNMLDTEWNRLPFEFEYPASKHSLEKPGNLSKILETARRLAKPFPFVRVDLYSIGDRIYFGELTFYPEKGAGRFSPRRYDEMLGSYLDLTRVSAGI